MGLAAIWLLSPIGGQAVLRTVEILDQPGTTDVAYMNTRAPSYAAVDGDFAVDWFEAYIAMYSASLLSPSAILDESTDLWGNVKIPRISHSDIESSDGEWLQIPRDEFRTYTSLFGIPIANLTWTNTTFSLESTYIDLVCDQQTKTALGQAFNTLVKVGGDGTISPYGPYVGFQKFTNFTGYAIGMFHTRCIRYRNQPYEALLC